MKRYQHCTWPVRIWRRRHLLVVPWRAFSAWLSGDEPLGLYWSIEVGLAHARMLWWYTLDEVLD